MDTLQEWVDRQYAHSAQGMLLSISSPVVKTRPGFDQTIRPAKGSVLASPVPASYDPDPDYFFHWYRDSSIVVDALRLLSEDADAGIETRQRFSDFVHFSTALARLDGRALVATPAWRNRVDPRFVQYLRTEDDLAGAHGLRIAAETRVNPDGTLDISGWPRPQYDGPAMRALVLLRWMHAHQFDDPLTNAIETLLRSDLDLTVRHAHESSFDIWEEDRGFHYYTLRIGAAALRMGARWLVERREHGEGRSMAALADEMLARLDGYWLPEEGYFRSRVLDSGARSPKELDISVILAAIHAGGNDALHSVDDPRMHLTLSRLAALFDAAYPINRTRPTDRGPAMGRYADDVYISGGAYYFSTLGAAEFCFQAALRGAHPSTWIERGDCYLRTVRAYTPSSGDLSEQFDQTTGEQTSAKHLSWSYAAFISCVAARRRALRSVTRARADSPSPSRRQVQRGR